MKSNIYKHYKGGLYTFMHAAVLESTGEEMAVYKCHRTEVIYTRPLKEFNEKFKLYKDKQKLTEDY